MANGLGKVCAIFSFASMRGILRIFSFSVSRNVLVSLKLLAEEKQSVFSGVDVLSE